MFCDKFFSKIKSFFKKIDDVLIANVDKALDVTKAIKLAIDSPVALAVVNIIPHEWDNELRALISKYLEWALKDMGFFKTMTDGTLTIDEKLKLLQDFIKDFNETEKNSFLRTLASRLTYYLDNRRFKTVEYDSTTQLRYHLSK